MAAPRTRLPCILLTLLLATAAVNKHEDPHEHAAALKKREVNSRHADAGKKQVKVTFTNYLPVAGGHRLWWDGGVGRQHQADLGYVKQTYIAGTFEGHRWWVENEDGETVWQMVVDEGKGYNQHVAISKDRSVKRTISSIIEHPELYDLHRLDSDYGAKHDHHGCADPVLVDDVVRVRAIGSEGAPAWVAQEDGLLSAALGLGRRVGGGHVRLHVRTTRLGRRVGWLKEVKFRNISTIFFTFLGWRLLGWRRRSGS